MASKRRLRRRSCENKRRHDTKQSASGHAFQLGLQYYQPYKCGFCKGWHVGRPTKEKKQAMAAKSRNY